MVRIRHLTPSDYQVMPWKNHRGTTSQIALFPESARFPTDPFLWRISTASIASSGPFSNFPGYDRTLVILEGSGASLNHDVKSQPVALERMKPYSFRGEWETTCELSDEAIRDFGLMVRREQVRAELKPLVLSMTGLKRAARWPTLLLYGVRGAISVRIDASSGPSEDLLRADELVWVENPGAENLLLELRVESGPAELILIGITPAGA